MGVWDSSSRRGGGQRGSVQLVVQGHLMGGCLYQVADTLPLCKGDVWVVVPMHRRTAQHIAYRKKILKRNLNSLHKILAKKQTCVIYACSEPKSSLEKTGLK